MDAQASAAFLGISGPHSLSPTCHLNAAAAAAALHASSSSPNASMQRIPTHQEYLAAAAQRLGELQASAAGTAGLADHPLSLEASHRLAAANRVNRKRALSTSPYSEMDLGAIIRHSPTLLSGSSLALNAAASALTGGGISPGSSGSYGQLSPGTMSPALGLHHQAAAASHLQQLQAHFLRSAGHSPYLSSPQNSLLHTSAAAAAAVLHSQSSYFHHLRSSGVTTTTTTAGSTSSGAATTTTTMTNAGESVPSVVKPEEPSSNVVSSTVVEEEEGMSSSKPRSSSSAKKSAFSSQTKVLSQAPLNNAMIKTLYP